MLNLVYCFICFYSVVSLNFLSQRNLYYILCIVLKFLIFTFVEVEWKSDFQLNLGSDWKVPANIKILRAKPFHCSVVCLFSVAFLLIREPLPQSLLFCSLQFFFQHCPHIMMLLPIFLHRGGAFRIRCQSSQRFRHAIATYLNSGLKESSEKGRVVCVVVSSSYF